MCDIIPSLNNWGHTVTDDDSEQFFEKCWIADTYFNMYSDIMTLPRIMPCPRHSGATAVYDSTIKLK